MRPGDILGLISDGIYEYENASGEQFGEERLARVVGAHTASNMQVLVDEILTATRTHGGPVPQADDITIVLVHRSS
jgi:sigma-B regulation protein RsbU (phosphoserine phosphatase)